MDCSIAKIINQLTLDRRFLRTLNSGHRIDDGKYNARFRQRSTQFSMSSAAMQAMVIFAEGNK